MGRKWHAHCNFTDSLFICLLFDSLVSSVDCLWIRVLVWRSIGVEDPDIEIGSLKSSTPKAVCSNVNSCACLCVGSGFSHYRLALVRWFGEWRRLNNWEASGFVAGLWLKSLGVAGLGTGDDARTPVKLLLVQVQSLLGRQVIQNFLSFTWAHLLHKPVLLHSHLSALFTVITSVS